MTEFNSQIEEIAEFAKENGFDPETQFDALIRAWIRMTYERSIWIQNNRDQAISIITQLV